MFKKIVCDLNILSPNFSANLITVTPIANGTEPHGALGPYKKWCKISLEIDEIGNNSTDPALTAKENAQMPKLIWYTIASSQDTGRKSSSSWSDFLSKVKRLKAPAYKMQPANIRI